MYIEKAKNIKNNWWRYFLIGPLIIFTFWQIIGAIPFGVGFGYYIYGQENFDMESANDIAAMFSVFPSKNIAIALFLLMFVFAFSIYIIEKIN